MDSNDGRKKNQLSIYFVMLHIYFIETNDSITRPWLWNHTNDEFDCSFVKKKQKKNLVVFVSPVDPNYFGDMLKHESNQPKFITFPKMQFNFSAIWFNFVNSMYWLASICVYFIRDASVLFIKSKNHISPYLNWTPLRMKHDKPNKKKFLFRIHVKIMNMLRYLPSEAIGDF